VVEAVKLGEPRAAGYLARIDRLFRWDCPRAAHHTGSPHPGGARDDVANPVQ
jgi:hypothetical protein